MIYKQYKQEVCLVSFTFNSEGLRAMNSNKFFTKGAYIEHIVSILVLWVEADTMTMESLHNTKRNHHRVK